MEEPTASKKTNQVYEWLFVSDVDDTLLGDEEALAVLNAALERARPRVGLALNSSRPCASLHRSLEAHRMLPSPDFLIGALGTEIEDSDGKRVEGYTRRFADGWDRDAVERLVPETKVLPHRPEYQTPFKISYDVKDAGVVDEVRQRLNAAGITATVLFTHRVAMDIIPDAAGKGAAIEFLRNHLKVGLDRVVVAGDSANDVDMFTDQTRGIVVANADAELKNLAGLHIYRSGRSFAAGVLDGLKHWNVL